MILNRGKDITPFIKMQASFWTNMSFWIILLYHIPLLSFQCLTLDISLVILNLFQNLRRC